MAYFPMFIDIEKKKCLVAGGGTVALRKVRVLLDFGAQITVVAPQIDPQILQLTGNVCVKVGGFPLGGSCQRLRPLTDEGQPCHCNPFTGSCGRPVPHPASVGASATFPRGGRHTKQMPDTARHRIGHS